VRGEIGSLNSRYELGQKYIPGSSVTAQKEDCASGTCQITGGCFLGGGWWWLGEKEENLVLGGGVFCLLGGWLVFGRIPRSGNTGPFYGTAPAYAGRWDLHSSVFGETLILARTAHGSRGSLRHRPGLLSELRRTRENPPGGFPSIAGDSCNVGKRKVLRISCDRQQNGREAVGIGQGAVGDPFKS